MVEHTSNKNPVLYTWELAGSQGASFILYPTAAHTKADIEEAKKDLRNSRDVVSLRVANDDDRDQLFKTEYFRDSRTRALRWYEIEQDEALIRRERLKGTTPAQFVDNFVLPYVVEVKARNEAKFGKSIYTY